MMWQTPPPGGKQCAHILHEPRKGGFSKGGFCRTQCHTPGNKKYPRILGPAVHLALKIGTAKEAYLLQKPPSRNPLFFIPESLIPMGDTQRAAPKVATPDDMIKRDLITKLARQAGLTAAAEQTMLIQGQIMSDGQPAPGSVRPIHRADVHIIEPQGSELWLDVKIHTVSPELSVAKEFLREVLTKCQA